MSRFVLDCSMTMAWCFDDEATPEADQVLASLANHEAVVPPLWRLEVVNVLLVAERKKRILPAQSHRFLELLDNLPIAVDTRVQPMSELLKLAREFRLTSYDACYLDLTLRAGLPLASLDGDLIAAGTKFGIPKF
jgi:predicted nucleic acid-binding protein